MLISNWLKVIQFAPSRIVVACNCSHGGGSSSTSNDKCSFLCRYRCKKFDTETSVGIRANKTITLIDDLLRMIWIIGKFSPCIGCDIISLRFVVIRTTTTNGQRRSFNICQRGPIMSIFWISIIMEDQSIVAWIINLSTKNILKSYLSHLLLWASEKQSKIRSSGKRNVPQAPNTKS